MIVRGTTELEASAKQELRAALKAYGADPDIIESARVRSVVQDSSESMRQQLQDLKVGLWIDAATHKVRLRGIGQGSLYTGEGVVGFWGYGESCGSKGWEPQPHRPGSELRPVVRAEVLRHATLDHEVPQAFNDMG